MFKTTALDSVGNAYVDKNVGTSTPGTRLEADDRNIIQDEKVNAVEASGQTLDPTGVKRDQEARAMFLNGVGAQSLVDSGTANAKVLVPVTGASGYVFGESYAQLTSAVFLFANLVTNTGAVTVNMGQTTGTLLGVKNLVQPDGSALSGGELIANGYGLILYDLANDRFELIYSTESVQIATKFPGLVTRPKYTWKDADEVYIEPFTYHHQGTSEQLVYCDLQLTFAFLNLAVSDWSYLYLDDSAIVTAGTNLIAIGQLIDSTTEPVWSVAKHGWYNGEDRCIFAVRTDGAGNILEFFHDGDLIQFADEISIESATAANTAFTDASAFVMPAFARKTLAWILWSYSNATSSLFWRTDGQAGATGHQVAAVGASSERSVAQFMPITGSNHIIEIKESLASTNTYTLKQNGWYFPTGM